jgi:hypothetical protein
MEPPPPSTARPAGQVMVICLGESDVLVEMRSCTTLPVAAAAGRAVAMGTAPSMASATPTEMTRRILEPPITHLFKILQIAGECTAELLDCPARIDTKGVCKRHYLRMSISATILQWDYAIFERTFLRVILHKRQTPRSAA